MTLRRTQVVLAGSRKGLDAAFDPGAWAPVAIFPINCGGALHWVGKFARTDAAWTPPHHAPDAPPKRRRRPAPPAPAAPPPPPQPQQWPPLSYYALAAVVVAAAAAVAAARPRP